MNSVGPLTSVIIPAHNAESSLAAAVDSVLVQSLPVHVIVVNDGSTDGTVDVARTYGKRIRLVEQSNSGQGAARNAGLALAQGAYVAFLDADDFWLPKFLECCVAFLEAHPEAVAVSTGIVIRRADNTEQVLPVRILDEPDRIVSPLVLEDFYRFWADEDHVRTGAVLIRRSVIDQAGPQRADLRISQDLEYWGYLATFGKWGFIPEPLWVGNSQVVAASKWLVRYRDRRRLCPTVEAWQQRILPRLSRGQEASFKVIRGRVAANYAQSKILGRAASDAFFIVKTYGSEMPKNTMTEVMIWGARYGRIGWQIACGLVRAKELAKALQMRVQAGRPR